MLAQMLAYNVKSCAITLFLIFNTLSNPNNLVCNLLKRYQQKIDQGQREAVKQLTILLN